MVKIRSEMILRVSVKGKVWVRTEILIHRDCFSQQKKKDTGLGIDLGMF